VDSVNIKLSVEDAEQELITVMAIIWRKSPIVFILLPGVVNDSLFIRRIPCP
jgi:hypothetical protein